VKRIGELKRQSAAGVRKPAHSNPLVSQLSLNLLVRLRPQAREPGSSQARVEVPVGAGIFVHRAEERYREAKRLRRRKTKGLVRDVDS
jgi:hypothetical protein